MVFENSPSDHETFDDPVYIAAACFAVVFFIALKSVFHRNPTKDRCSRWSKELVIQLRIHEVSFHHKLPKAGLSCKIYFKMVQS